MAQLDREVLFANEQFVIGVAQAVSGGSLVAALAQLSALQEFAGDTAARVFFTAQALALLLAVVAAYWKHQYKLWDVKAQVSASQNLMTEAQHRGARSQFYLVGMRTALVGAILAIAGGMVGLVAASWWKAACTA